MLELLREKRKRVGMTQLYVANTLGIAKSTYSRKENGKIPFSTQEIKKVSKLFNLTPKELVGIFFNN